MANMEYHEIYLEGIKEKLLEKGVVGEKKLSSKRYPEGKVFPFVLDYGKCNEKEWAKEKTSILEEGVKDYGKKNEDGSYGFRRDYTEKEASELGFYPVFFSEDGNRMSWECRYISNEDPAFYASDALPEEVMIFSMFYEGEYDGGCYLKAGKKITEIPTAPLIGANGNIFNLGGIASDVLREAGLADQVPKMQKRITQCSSYEEALGVISDYVIFGEAEE